MAKTCSQIFSNTECTIIGNPEEIVTGLAFRSDCVKPGDAFFCIVGFNNDGHSYAQDAINRGAKVLVVERKVYLADATDVTEIVVSDSRKAMAEASVAFYDNPSQQMDVVGVTGTNGKTTTTYLIDHILNSCGRSCGVIGTIGLKIKDEFNALANTTPESPDLQALFAQALNSGCDSLAIEVSSHALDLFRTWHTNFAVTVFTNLTQDHLDFHHNFESYFEAKAKLFSSDYPAKRVICIDDEWGELLAIRCRESGGDVVTTGFSEKADIHPKSIEYTSSQTEVVFVVRGAEIEVRYPFVGRFNVSNVMSALGAAVQLGIDLESIVKALSDVPGVPGRLQKVEADSDVDISIYIDYAHTPDALEKAIASIKEINPNRTIVVFGCGGDRDSSKRSIMGNKALTADYAVVTSDNPRSEDPIAIIDDIVAGMSEEKDRFIIEPDRRSAIKIAIDSANAGDAILIAGKGHEDYQLVGDKVLPFSDYDVALAELNRAFNHR